MNQLLTLFSQNFAWVNNFVLILLFSFYYQKINFFVKVKIVLLTKIKPSGDKQYLGMAGVYSNL